MVCLFLKRLDTEFCLMQGSDMSLPVKMIEVDKEHPVIWVVKNLSLLYTVLFVTSNSAGCYIEPGRQVVHETLSVEGLYIDLIKKVFGIEKYLFSTKIFLWFRVRIETLNENFAIMQNSVFSYISSR